MGSFRRAALTAAVGVAALLVGGCGPTGRADDSGSDGRGTGGSTGSSASGSPSSGSHTSGGRYVSVVPVDSPVMAFGLRLTADEKLDHAQQPHVTASSSPSSGAAACTDTSSVPSSADWANLEQHGKYLATFEVDPRRCGAGSPVSGNGRRPLFHSPADLSGDQRSRAHRFPIGSGTVITFEQPYFECTQSCRNWSEPVALITPRFPADRDYPTLVVRSDRAALDREDLENLIRHQLRLPTSQPSPSSSSTASG